MKRLNFVLLLTICMAAAGYAQKIATLEVELPVSANGIDVPVSIHLDEITFVADSLLVLSEVKGKEKDPVAFQIENDDRRILHWMIKGSGTQKKYTFELSRGKAAHQKALTATSNDGMLTIQSGDQNLLRYYHKTLYPPKGVDPAYRRSGFIHPLWSPKGQELTRIQPPDHYHHYGIWNPWTRVLYDGDTVDFWNLASKQGTVRFANFVSVTGGGPIFSGFEALHEHVVFKRGEEDKVAMNELQSVRVYRPQQDADYYIADITMKLNTAGNIPVKILEYRYAGLGWRATEKWDRNNSEVLTSEGKNRKEADGSKARWCIVQGEIDDDYAGVVMMSHPANYNHPEPLRIWPENIYDRGDMFASFTTTKDTDWLLEPGKNYLLRYRLLVYNGKTDKEKAESAWKYFATPPKVSVTLAK